MARYVEAAVELDFYAEELLYGLDGNTFANWLNLEEWLAIPTEAGPPALAGPPAVAGPPASETSDDMDLSEPEAIPATDNELTQVLGRPYRTHREQVTCLDTGFRGHPLQDTDITLEEQEALGMDLDEAICFVALRSRARDPLEPVRGHPRLHEPRARLRARTEYPSRSRKWAPVDRDRDEDEGGATRGEAAASSGATRDTAWQRGERVRRTARSRSRRRASPSPIRRRSPSRQTPSRTPSHRRLPADREQQE